MADNRLIIDINSLVRDAFYAIPDFTDESGSHLGGVYGALFKILSDLKTGDFERVEVVHGDEELSLIKEQVQNFEKLWTEVLLELGVTVE